MCTVQAVLFFYGGLINAVAWMMISLDLYFKIVLGKNIPFILFKEIYNCVYRVLSEIPSLVLILKDNDA